MRPGVPSTVPRTGIAFCKGAYGRFQTAPHETARSRQSDPEAYNSIPNPYITFMYPAVTHKLRSFI